MVYCSHASGVLQGTGDARKVIIVYCSHASGVLQGTGDARKVVMIYCSQSSNVMQSPGDAREVISLHCSHASGVLQGTGDAGEVALEDRRVLALEGLVVVALVVKRPTDGQPLAAQSIRITTRAMWTKRGELIQQMQKVGPGKGPPCSHYHCWDCVLSGHPP